LSGGCSAVSESRRMEHSTPTTGKVLRAFQNKKGIKAVPDRSAHARVSLPCLGGGGTSSAADTDLGGAKWGAIISRHRATPSVLESSIMTCYLVTCRTEPHWPTLGISMAWRGSGVRIPSAPPRGLHVSVGPIFTFASDIVLAWLRLPPRCARFVFFKVTSCVSRGFRACCRCLWCVLA
jgi:hypothetical protein